jgi:hypothetical protein
VAEIVAENATNLCHLGPDGLRYIVRAAGRTAAAKLREVVDERKLRFDVEVRDGDRTLGVAPTSGA